MPIVIIVVTIIVIANDVGDNFKYLPIIVFPWYFLLPHDPFVPFQQLHHMASIAFRKRSKPIILTFQASFLCCFYL